MRAALAGIAALAAAGTSAAPVDPVTQFRDLRAVDARLAAIGYRLATANAALCADKQPGTGAVIHAIDQYAPALRPAARSAFGFPAPVAVETVVPGSPAEAAGVAAGDGVAAVAGRPVPAATNGPATPATRDAVLALIDAQPADAPLSVSLVHGGERVATLRPVPACHARFEVLLGPAMTAQSDGLTVQIGVCYLARYDDATIAAIAAHELSHVILRHRARLEAAGVHWGVFAEVGRSARLFRRTEDEADALSVALLRNAGYDPQAAVRFWQGGVGGLDGGVFHSRTHGSAGARARAIAAAIAAISAGAPTPYVPPLVATRDQPLE